MQTLLPVLLIILTLVILVKHYDNKMKTGEVVILVMIFILVCYACYCYMKLEGFADYKASMIKNSFNGSNGKLNTIKKLGEEDEEDDDDGPTADNFKDGGDVQSARADAIFAEQGMESSDFKKMIGVKSKFGDVVPSTTTSTTTTSTTTPYPTDGLEAADGLKSVFNPSIVISGKGGRINALGGNLYSGNDNKDSSSIDDYQKMMAAAQSGNSGSYYYSSGYNQDNSSNATNSNAGANTNNTSNIGFPYASADYDYWSNMSKDNAKDGKGLDGKPLLVFPKSKLYYPGFQYINPILWDVPQRRPEMCIPSREVYPPAGVVETKFSFLEYNEMGKIADQEKQVKETNVGSIMPPFVYKSLPYATP